MNRMNASEAGKSLIGFSIELRETMNPRLSQDVIPMAFS
jgi:hypothetical protein